jgi:hypothetical protein
MFFIEPVGTRFFYVLCFLKYLQFCVYDFIFVHTDENSTPQHFMEVIGMIESSEKTQNWSKAVLSGSDR